MKLDLKTYRLRRLRRTPWSRKLVQEHHLLPTDLIWPFFLCHGKAIQEPIQTMPGVFRYSIDTAIEACLEAKELGVMAVAPFPHELLHTKTIDGHYVTHPENLTNCFLREFKKICTEIGVITDPALDPYTSHGHDGILKNGIILNDETVEVIAKGALAQVQSGADIIAPSDMMDHRVYAIRTILDENGFQDIPILAYTAKYASSFYGPYRDAIGTNGLLKGDKKSYYLNITNSREATQEAMQDLTEGADMLLVKPGLPYLDIVNSLSKNLNLPIFSYQVSGEYAMIKAAGMNKWINEEAVMMETLMSLKRAGSCGIFTYFAKEAAKLLNKGWQW